MAQKKSGYAGPKKKNNAMVLIVIFAVVVILFAAIALLSNKANDEENVSNSSVNNTSEQTTIDLENDENYQNIILPEELSEKIASGEKVYAYLFSPECPHCRNFTPKLMPLAEENDIHIDQVNVLEYQELWDTYNIEATPTLIVFENGEEVTRLVGDYETEEVQQFFDSVQ